MTTNENGSKAARIGGYYHPEALQLPINHLKRDRVFEPYGVRGPLGNRSLRTSATPVKASEQDWTWLFRVDRGTTRQGGHAAGHLVRRTTVGHMLQALVMQRQVQPQFT